MNTDQLAAEAANEIEECFPAGTQPFVELERMALHAIIKSAIEKATFSLRKEIDSLEGALHHPNDPRHTCIFKDKLRAAHASEQEKWVRAGNTVFYGASIAELAQSFTCDSDEDALAAVEAHNATLQQEEQFGLCLSHRAAYRLAKPDKCPICRLLEESQQSDDTKRLDWLLSDEGFEWLIKFTENGNREVTRQDIDAAISATEGIQTKEKE